MRLTSFSMQINIKFDDNDLALTSDYKIKVQEHWDSLEKDGKILFNGPLYAIVHMDETEKELNIIVQKTSYAYYLYVKMLDNNANHNLQIMYTSALVEL